MATDLTIWDRIKWAFIPGRMLRRVETEWRHRVQLAEAMRDGALRSRDSAFRTLEKERKQHETLDREIVTVALNSGMDLPRATVTRASGLLVGHRFVHMPEPFSLAAIQEPHVRIDPGFDRIDANYVTVGFRFVVSKLECTTVANTLAVVDGMHSQIEKNLANKVIEEMQRVA